MACGLISGGLPSTVNKPECQVVEYSPKQTYSDLVYVDFSAQVIQVDVSVQVNIIIIEIQFFRTQIKKEIPLAPSSPAPSTLPPLALPLVPLICAHSALTLDVTLQTSVVINAVT